MVRCMIDFERVIHSIKTALACLVGFVITKLLHIQVDQWLIITILVVMCAQISVGSVIQKSYMRFLGTLSGSLIAALTLRAYGTDPLAIATIIAIAAMIFSYIATGESSFSDSGALAIVTVVIILIGKNPTISTAAERFMEISIGILIAALISQFVLPIHARHHLVKTQATTLRQLRDYYIATLIIEENQESIINYQLPDEDIVKSLIKQRKLAKDAVRELLGDAFNPLQFNQSLICEKEILRCITFMHFAYKASPHNRQFFSNEAVVKNFHLAACEALDALADFLEHNKRQPKTLSPYIHELKKIIDENTIKFNRRDAVYIDSFLFCAEILVARMDRLTELVANTK